MEWILLMIYTWNTVRQDCGNVSKWLRVPSLTSENLPPKICIPNNENIKMKRNKITSSEFIDVIEFTSDLTKWPNEDQYLKHGIQCNIISRISKFKDQLRLYLVVFKTIFVIVNIKQVSILELLQILQERWKGIVYLGINIIEKAVNIFNEKNRWRVEIFYYMCFGDWASLLSFKPIKHQKITRSYFIHWQF